MLHGVNLTRIHPLMPSAEDLNVFRVDEFLAEHVHLPLSVPELSSALWNIQNTESESHASIVSSQRSTS